MARRLARDSKWPTFTVQSGDCLILLVCSLSFSLPLFNTAILSFFPPISPSPTHFPARFVCLLAVRCHWTESGRPNPNGISSYTVYMAVSPFAPVAILGNEVRVRRGEKNETWRQAIPRCLRIRERQSFRRPKATTMSDVASDPPRIRKIFPKAGLCDCSLRLIYFDTWTRFETNHTWCAIESSRTTARELFGNHKSSTKRCGASV